MEKELRSTWLTKKMLLEALKMAEGLPQDTFVYFNGSSKMKDDVEYTVMQIEVPANGKKKTVTEEFHKLLLSNNME